MKDFKSITIDTAETEVSIDFERAAALVLGQFQLAALALLDAMPGEMRRAADVERAFGLDPRLAWHIHKIAHAPNPMASVANIPAGVSIKRLLKVASDKQIAADVIDGLAIAYDQVERFITAHAGDRERFVAMIGPLIRDEADGIESKNKKAAYKAMSNLVGVDAKAQMHAMLIHPGAEAGRVDIAVLRASLKLHRLRSASPLFLPLYNSRTTNGVDKYTEGVLSAIDGDQHSYLLDEFCSPGLEIRRIVGGKDESRAMEIAQAVGRQSSVNVVYASVSRGVVSPHASPGDPVQWHQATVNVPTETLLIDTLLHKDALPVQHPLASNLKVFTNHRMDIGTDEPSYAEHADLLSLNERCEHLGRGVELLATSDSPKHVAMLRFMCEKLGWNPNEFYVYRCRVEYPIFKSTVRIVFDLTSNS